MIPERLTVRISRVLALAGACLAIGMGARAADPFAAPPQDAMQARNYLELGNSLDGSGHSKEAIAAYTRAIDLGLRPEGLRERGVAYTTAGDFDAARSDLDEAVRLEPSDGVARFDRAWLYFDKGQFSAAAADAQAAATLEPQDPYPYILQFMALLKAGRDAGAVMRAGQARFGLETWPGPVFALFLGQASPEQVTAAGLAGGWQAGCEWPYYVGEYWLRQGREEAARSTFGKGLRDECRPVIEFREAHRALMNLDRESALSF